MAARAGLAAAALAAVVLLVVLLSSGAGPLPGGPTEHPPALADPVPYDGRSPVQPAGEEQRVLVELSRPALGELRDARAMGAEDQQRYVASLKREATALRSALGARGVGLRDVVAYYRVFNGFAATVRTRDVARLNSRGARVRSVRRLYPATGEPVPVGGKAPAGAAPAPGQPPVAVLDTGVDSRALGGRADPGYDAVDRDRDPAPGPDPRDTRRRETSGTALAGVLAAAGERVLPVRVASLRATAGGGVEAVGTADELIAGLEHAVDPNGDADTSDHVPVALVGVNAPYAGFSNSPEAQAVRGAAGLGTLVVAPAGNDGAAQPGSGTVGSPGAAPDALAVGALAGPEPAPRVSVEAGGARVAQAAVLAGSPPRGGGLATAGPVTTADPAALSRQGLAGKVVVVRAAANPGAQAAAAAAAGARAVLLADPRDRPLPAMAAGRAGAPVVGVTGAGARALLALRPGEGIEFGDVRRGPRPEAPARPNPAPYTSAGPSAGGLPKPDLAAPGSALTVAPMASEEGGGAAGVGGAAGGGGTAGGGGAGGGGAAGGGGTAGGGTPAQGAGEGVRGGGEAPRGLGGGAAVAGGTAIAAARVAAAASRLARARPELSPAQLRAALIGAADPAGLPVERAGAGALRAPPEGGVTADPPAPATLPIDPVTVRLSAAASTELRLRVTAGATVDPATLTLRPGAPAPVRVRVSRPGPGRLEAVDRGGRVVASVPWLVRPQDVAPVPLGRLRVTRGRGVRFALGAFDRGDPLGAGTSLQLAERLVLELVTTNGAVRRTLTVPGGARELMPAEYAYTLPSDALKALPPGRYAFRARAWAPRQRDPTEGRSKAFSR